MDELEAAGQFVVAEHDADGRLRARAADSQGISVSQYVREAALIRAVLDDLDYAEQAVHTAHDLLAIAREVRRLAEVDPPGPPRASAGRRRSASANDREDS